MYTTVIMYNAKNHMYKKIIIDNASCWNTANIMKKQQISFKIQQV